MTYEVMKNYDMWDCPFCGQNMISVVHYPKTVSVKRSTTASLPGSKAFHVNRDVYVISSGCVKCGRTAVQVEKALKDDGVL